MAIYDLDKKITTIEQCYLPGFEKREPARTRRLVLTRTTNDFWQQDTLPVAGLIRELLINGYGNEEHALLEGAWRWVQGGGYIEV